MREGGPPNRGDRRDRPILAQTALGAPQVRRLVTILGVDTVTAARLTPV